MEWALASIAVALLCYAALAGRLEGTPLTAAMAFTGFGLLIGSEAQPDVESTPAPEIRWRHPLGPRAADEQASEDTQRRRR